MNFGFQKQNNPHKEGLYFLI
uniref:Uncharacterized protein n=1 Tax=Rhizophora mucronata TaxID=61149 RepID=A0A2P2NTM4_RHIMU